ncbi:hypothetical protein P0L94_12585 [Microbacter sp. GSS18]|nr:hypothetical protein P0L94_12585 [Microbacter sp. GSS18]
MDTARIVVLSWPGCGSHDDALALVADALAELGRPDEPVVVRWIETPEDAEAARFVGSPTIRVDDVDIVPPQAERYGLTCRVYPDAEGRLAPLPPRDTVLERLRELL